MEAYKRSITTIAVFHVAFFALILFLYLQATQELKNQLKAREIIAESTILSKQVYDAGLAIGVFALTKNQSFSDRYTKLAQEIPDTLEALHALMDQQAINNSSFEVIKKVADNGLIELANAKNVIDTSASYSILDKGAGIHDVYKRVKLIANDLENKLEQLSHDQEKLAGECSKRRTIFKFLFFISLVAYVTVNIFVQVKLVKSRQKV